jgi:hypothetical protein
MCGCGIFFCELHPPKRRYTVENPPRVYEVAKAIGLPSNSTIDWLRDYDPEYVFRTASHKVPLGHAIRFLQYMKTV